MKVMQFGEGNFLRSFVDLYLDTLNKEGINNYEVSIIKPIAYGSLDSFAKQNNLYHVVLRGYEKGKTKEDVYKVNCVKEVISPFTDLDRYYALSEDKDIKIIISNTTEAGITFNKEDKREDMPNISYPGKLTLWLYNRYLKGLDGVYILPVELIENNADELAKCVDEYIDLWNLGEEFKKFNYEKNFYCNTLVDRIVSGFPKDEDTKKHIFNLIGEEDNLVSIAEPFGLWVIQDKGEISNLLSSGLHNINVIFDKDISYYKKRKVRILNGSHTNMVPISLWRGKDTVYSALMDKKLKRFIKDTLDEEIIPYVSDNLDSNKEFANDVIERFLNPYLNHQLTSIALNSISKWKARVLPSFDDYYKDNRIVPHHLTIGFSYLLAMYQHIEEVNGKYICHLPSRDIEVKDDIEYLTYFNNHDVHDFLSDISIWGKDLTTYRDFEAHLRRNLLLINSGKDLI